MNAIQSLTKELAGAVEAYIGHAKDERLKLKIINNVGPLRSPKEVQALIRYQTTHRAAATKAAQLIIPKLVAALPRGQAVIEGWLYELSACLDQNGGIKAAWPKLRVALETVKEPSETTTTIPNPSIPVSLEVAASAWGGSMSPRKLADLTRKGRIKGKQLSRQLWIFSRDDIRKLPAQ